MVRAYSLHGRNSRPKEWSSSTRFGSPRAVALAGPGTIMTHTSKQAQSHAATTGLPVLGAPNAERPPMLFPGSLNRPNAASQAILARIALRPTAYFAGRRGQQDVVTGLAACGARPLPLQHGDMNQAMSRGGPSRSGDGQR